LKAKTSLLFLLTTLAIAAPSGDKPLTVEDIMRFNHIEDPVISEDGAFVGYGVRRDRGDGEAVIRSTSGPERYRIPRATKPAFTKDGKWAGMALNPPELEVEKAGDDKQKKEKLKQGFALVDTANGDTWTWDRVKAFAFSDDSRWLAVHFFPEEEKAEKAKSEEGASPEAAAPEPAGTEKPKKKKPEKDLGTKVLLRNLTTAQEFEIAGVSILAFDPLGRYLVYAVSLPEGTGNGISFRQLTTAPDVAVGLVQEDRGSVASMAWNKAGERFAYLYAVKEIPPPDEEKDGPKKKQAPLAHHLRIWQPDRNRSFTVNGPAGEHYIPAESELTWSKDSQRLFFGIKAGLPAVPTQEPGKPETEADLFDVARLRAQRSLDVWHGQDPFIKPNERKRWENEKKRTLLCVFHAKNEKTVQLADETVPETIISQNEEVLLQSSDLNYRREATWSGGAEDYYAVSLADGKRTLIARGLRGFRARPSLSPGGQGCSTT